MDATTAGGRQDLVERSGSSPAWVNVLGVRVSAVNLRSATDRLLAAVAERTKVYVCVRDAHGVIRCQKDEELRSAHNRAFLVTPDGMPLVWALRRAGHTDSGRVYGPDLMASLLEAGLKRGVRHFLYGATADTLRALEARLVERFPGALIVGAHAPPFRELSPEEETSIVAMINRSEADIVWVGIGTPKQEMWMARMRNRLNPPVLIGVGAAFDFHAGKKRQAPLFIQRSGLEWLFRLLCEPRRLWRRYAVTVPSYLALSALQRLGWREFRLDEPGTWKPGGLSEAMSSVERTEYAEAVHRGAAASGRLNEGSRNHG